MQASRFGTKAWRAGCTIAAEPRVLCKYRPAVRPEIVRNMKTNYFTRAYAKPLIWFMAVVAVIQAFGILIYLSGRTLLAVCVLSIGATSVSAAYLVWMRRLNRDTREQLRASGSKLCLNCGYNRQNLPDERFCPECGSRFEGDAAVRDAIDGLATRQQGLRP